ncbi:hypothetical protein [Paenibacillus sedimenti]|uniref:Uncharacterized protein n=1 Tax=Paenibacillus sedimenti TaxID=2770274 RepID=A0A926KQE0_9BACL|nr:hypothetical protein [Paenibacillus sedimenti]MBD0381241.1 hypothetical protein [Paenibacillus sedimenti]
MTVLELLNSLKKDAERYVAQGDASVKRNRHMNELAEAEGIDQRHIEAILVDFINNIAGRYGIDYALYTIDIRVRLESEVVQ